MDSTYFNHNPQKLCTRTGSPYARILRFGGTLLRPQENGESIMTSARLDCPAMVNRVHPLERLAALSSARFDAHS
jgi:hypothetical protein